MIGRIWRGWTTPDNAAAFEQLWRQEILPGIVDQQIPGYRGAHLLRRELTEEVEFVTILWLESLDAARAFAGEEHEVARVPPAARMLLSRFEPRVQHYETLVQP